MKAFALFITVIMLFASINLCRDNDASDDCIKLELSKNCKNKTEKDNACSPFCHCARCAFSILLPGLNRPLLLQSSSVKLFIESSEGRPTRLSEPIWQPPKAA